MKHHKRHPTSLREAVFELVDDGPVDERLLRVVERPDGYHWVDAEGRQEFGPYESVEAALADMDQPGEGSIEQAEQVELAEQALDIDARVDPADEDGPEGAT